MSFGKIPDWKMSWKNSGISAGRADWFSWSVVSVSDGRQRPEPEKGLRFGPSPRATVPAPAAKAPAARTLPNDGGSPASVPSFSPAAGSFQESEKVNRDE